MDVLDSSLRCEKCKGFWVANWVVNNVAAGKEIKADRAGVEPVFGQGTNRCPVDGTLLLNPPKGSIPDDLAAEKCITCSGWWFPGDELFNFQTAFKAKTNYLKQWKKGDWVSYAWPALVVAFLGVGIIGGVVLVKNRQQATISASIGVNEFVATTVSQGQVEIRFKAEHRIETVEYKRWDEVVYKTATVEIVNGWNLVRISGLSSGEYQMKIMGVIYRFTI